MSFLWGLLVLVGSHAAFVVCLTYLNKYKKSKKGTELISAIFAVVYCVVSMIFGIIYVGSVSTIIGALVGFCTGGIHFYINRPNKESYEGTLEYEEAEEETDEDEEAEYDSTIYDDPLEQEEFGVNRNRKKAEVTKYTDILVGRKIIPQKEFYIPYEICHEYVNPSVAVLKTLLLSIVKKYQLSTILAINAKFMNKKNANNSNGSSKTSAEIIEKKGETDGLQIIIYINDKDSIYDYAACIAHECAHCFLRNQNISLPDIDENEILTDVLTVFFGFGTIMKEAYEMKEKVDYVNSTTQTSKLGYLTIEEISDVEKIVSNMLAEEGKKKKELSPYRICPNCKFKTDKLSKFCKHCGFEIN